MIYSLLTGKMMSESFFTKTEVSAVIKNLPPFTFTLVVLTTPWAWRRVGKAIRIIVVGIKIHLRTIFLRPGM